jgi:hypothetical protein
MGGNSQGLEARLDRSQQIATKTNDARLSELKNHLFCIGPAGNPLPFSSSGPSFRP